MAKWYITLQKLNYMHPSFSSHCWKGCQTIGCQTIAGGNALSFNHFGSKLPTKSPTIKSLYNKYHGFGFLFQWVATSHDSWTNFSSLSCCKICHSKELEMFGSFVDISLLWQAIWILSNGQTLCFVLAKNSHLCYWQLCCCLVSISIIYCLQGRIP